MVKDLAGDATWTAHCALTGLKGNLFLPAPLKGKQDPESRLSKRHCTFEHILANFV